MPEQTAEQIAFSFGGSDNPVVSVSNHRAMRIECLVERLNAKRYERDDYFKLALNTRDSHDKYHPKVDHWLMMREVTRCEIDQILEELFALGYAEADPDEIEYHQDATIRAFDHPVQPTQLQLLETH